MNDGVKITIEEWAGDNNISASSEQVDELAEAIDISYSMSLPCGYGVGQVETREKDEIDLLKYQIDMLTRYIDSKGYHITLFNDRIERMYMVNRGIFSASQYETFK